MIAAVCDPSHPDHTEPLINGISEKVTLAFHFVALVGIQVEAGLEIRIHQPECLIAKRPDAGCV